MGRRRIAAARETAPLLQAVTRTRRAVVRTKGWEGLGIRFASREVRARFSTFSPGLSRGVVPRLSDIALFFFGRSVT